MERATGDPLVSKQSDFLVGGGEPNGKIQLFNDPQVNNIVIPIYKNREKRIFEFGVRLNPPHLT